MDTPFNGIDYTAEFIRDLQAGNVGDVVANDPGVRVARGFGNFQELYVHLSQRRGSRRQRRGR
jgi:iron complex outermembrane receptor protein